MGNPRRRQIILENDAESGGWTASVPSLPGCLSQGKSRREAEANAKDAISAWLEGAVRVGLPIPPEDRSAGR